MGELKRAIKRVIGVGNADDLAWAAENILFSRLGGSALVPRGARRAIYRYAGGSLESAPGMGFTFAGKAANLTIGRNVFMNQQVFVEAIAPVTIGDDCALGMQSMICTSHHPIAANGRWRRESEGRAVVLGQRVWVGARALILPGSVIEDDVIVAAGAVVAGRCLASGVYAGVPARRIRDL